MIDQAVTISDHEIVIRTQFFVRKDYSFSYREALLDIFSNHYNGQTILISALDGENLDASGFTDFIKYLCSTFNIDREQVTVETHDAKFNHFKINHLLLGIFNSVNRYIPDEFNKDMSKAKFVGTLLGRLNPTRIRLAYELDQQFPNNNFTVFQPNINQLMWDYRSFTEIYSKEFAWLSTKQFDKDLSSTHNSGMIDWQQSCAAYGQIWSQFQVEIVSETDAVSDFWLTEKTARCLATGKPFVLVAGQNSLSNLHDMGFKTYGDLIDETYDSLATPTQRIKQIMASLNELYHSPNKSIRIEQMYQQAQYNVEFYKQYNKGIINDSTKIQLHPL